MHPISVQLELTYACNNSCAFCYNTFSNLDKREPLPLDRFRGIFHDLSEIGVFTINFNGGEPLCRQDFFPIVDEAKSFGFDIHLNTNGTLITKDIAPEIARRFSAICTSIHGSNSQEHDSIVGRRGAFCETVNAIRLLQGHGVYVTVNVVLSQRNKNHLLGILDLLRRENIQTVLLTRILTADNSLSIGDTELMVCIRQLKTFTEEVYEFARIAFPQPFRICEIADEQLVSFVSNHNISCAAGRITVRITPDGLVTPCPLLLSPIIGDLQREDFLSIWNRWELLNWFKPMPYGCKCHHCSQLARCGGGCIAQKNGVLYV